MYKLFYFISILSFLAFSCSDKKQAAISGQLENSNGEMLYLEELLPNTTFALDSARIDDNGRFAFSTSVPELGFYMLKFGEDRNNAITLLMDSTEEIVISGDMKSMVSSYQVRGSEGSALVKELTMNSLSINEKLDSLGKVFQAAQGKPEFMTVKTQIDAAFGELIKETKEQAAAFIDKHPASLATIIALYQRVGRSMVFNQGDANDMAYFMKVDSALMKAYPQSKHVQALHMRVENMKRELAQLEAQQKVESSLAPGTVAPEIEMNTPEGKSLALSSLRGKVVLIDFWASWCKPCRYENPHVVKMYKKYKDKGFEIYGVSLDRNKQSWVKAIEDDNLTWIHVSDLAYWSSPILKVYGINSIPSTVLVDREGKIIARNLRGQTLEDKLEEIFG